MHLPAGSAGLLLAALPVGMGLGNVCAGRLAGPQLRERLTRPLLLVLGAPLTLFVLRPPLVVAGVLLLVAGTGFAYELGVQRRFLDVVPEQVRGQAFGLVSTLVMFGQGVGPIVFGALGSAFTPSTAMALSGCRRPGHGVVPGAAPQTRQVSTRGASGSVRSTTMSACVHGSSRSWCSCSAAR